MEILKIVAIIGWTVAGLVVLCSSCDPSKLVYGICWGVLLLNLIAFAINS